MNILFISNNPFNPALGGIERVTDTLAKELLKRGHHVFYLCEKVSTEYINILDYDFPAKLFLLPESGLLENNTNLQFYKQLQTKLNIDIVINQRGLGGWFNEFLYNTSSKVISVIHSVPDSAVKQLLKTLYEQSKPPLLRFKKIVKKTFSFIFIIYWSKRLKSELEASYENLAHYSDAIVTLSNPDIDILKTYVSPIWKHKILSIGNPNSYISPTLKCLSDKKKIILYVGRLTEFEKAPMRILYIWKSLIQKYSDWQLKVVGDGPDKSMMEEYVKKHNLINVCFEGQKKDITSYYKEASFVCLTSNFEGWGMSLTEGMQYGCIPFTFNNYGAASDIIDDNINGCLIKPFDLKQYAARLAELMEDKSKREMIAKASYEKVEEFSAKNIVDKWEKLFNQL